MRPLGTDSGITSRRSRARGSVSDSRKATRSAICCGLSWISESERASDVPPEPDPAVDTTFYLTGRRQEVTDVLGLITPRIRIVLNWFEESGFPIPEPRFESLDKLAPHVSSGPPPKKK